MDGWMVKLGDDLLEKEAKQKGGVSHLWGRTRQMMMELLRFVRGEEERAERVRFDVG